MPVSVAELTNHSLLKCDFNSGYVSSFKSRYISKKLSAACFRSNASILSMLSCGANLPISNSSPIRLSMRSHGRSSPRPFARSPYATRIPSSFHHIDTLLPSKINPLPPIPYSFFRKSIFSAADLFLLY